MLYKGRASCEKHGEFEWQIFEAEANKAIFGIDFKTKWVINYDKMLKLVIVYCPECHRRIEIKDYNFDKTN